MDWATYFLNIADVVRLKSKDPSTKIGAVIVGPENQIVSTGFNGFPRGVNETLQSRWERPAKYQWIEHAERNAIYNAARHGIPLRGCRMYLVGMGPPTIPCTDCARAVIQAGIKTVIGRAYKETSDTWAEDIRVAQNMLSEAEVKLLEIDE